MSEFDKQRAVSFLDEIERAKSAISALTSQLAQERDALSRAKAGLNGLIGGSPSLETVREHILDLLKQRPAGVKVAEVREYLDAEHGITVHEKTPGMTLYRLMGDGLAHRKGRVWFAGQSHDH